MARLSALTVLLVIVSVHLGTSVMIPPKITKQSVKDIFYKKGETVKMECEASGDPKPSYFWKRAELSFSPEGNDDRIVKQKDVGTLIINSPEDKDEGIYQCFATNSQGTAATDKFNLKMAKLDEFTTSDPITHDVQLGNPLTMNCQSPNSVPDAQIYWVVNVQGDMQPVSWDSRVTMDYEDRLYFTYVANEDYKDGNAYHCVAYNNYMRKSVLGPPQFINPKGANLLTSPMTKLWPKSRFDEQGLLGTNFRMKCIFSGNPPPIVKWKRKDLPFSSRVQLGNSGGQEIVINDLQFEDAGTYLCDGTREQESTPLEMSFILNINSRPTWRQKPKDVSIAENGTAQFECSADGVPKPRIFWFVNGQPLEDALKNDRRLDYRFHHLQEEKIILEHVTKLDTMVFQCNASNIHGYVWEEAFLNVLLEAPTILDFPRNLKVAEGEQFEMPCQVTGKPDPIITWFKNGQQVTGGRYMIRESGNMYVQAAVLSDAGEYRCFVRNMMGNETAFATLIVRRETVIQSKPMDIEVQRGVYAKFTCSGTTDPEETEQLATTWLKDGDPIDLGTRMFSNIQDHSLTVSGTEQRDTGTYTCILSNGLDNDTASARLVVTDVPSAPYDLLIKEECLKEGSAELVWTAGSFNNAPIQYFIIEYVTDIDPNRWVFATQIDYRKDTAFIPLAAGMNYTFRVVAYNKIGPSIPSVPSNTSCVTTPSTPTQNPRNVRTIGDKPGMLHIQWTPVPPEHQGGKKFTYQITVLRVGDPESGVYTTTIQDWKVYDFLYPATGADYTRYRITVKSRNTEGDSSEPAPVIYGYSSEGAPNVWPTVLSVADIQSNTAIFTWQFDRSQIGKDDSQIRGEFRGFKIQVWEQNKQAETIREYDVSPEDALNNSTDNTFRATVPHLTPNTQLQARVALLNNFFVSKPSDIISFVTPRGLPGPVQLLEDLNVGDNHINLQWRTPIDNRGDVIGYDIGYQEVHGLHLDEMQDRMPQIDDPYATTAMLSGLLPNTKYRIHMWARTAAGRGDDFFIERTTTSPGVPMIPRFTIANVGTDFINVTWWRDAYQRSGSVVFVQHRKEDGAEWFSNTPDVSRSWVKIDFLQPGFKYTVRIAVTNGEITRVSQEEDVRTDGTAKAYDVVANLGWFLGMIFSVLLEIFLVVLFVICYRRGFRFKTDQREIRTYRNGADTYTGTHYNKEEIPRVSKDFGPEPGGYSNDMYKDEYGDEYDDDGPDGFGKYNDNDYKYTDEYADRPESPSYDPGEEPTYRDVADAGNTRVGHPAGDYEEYNIDERMDSTFNKSDYSEPESYSRQHSNYSSDNEGRGRSQNERSGGGRKKETEKEVIARVHNDNRRGAPSDRQRQKDQHRKHGNSPVDHEQDHDRDDGHRQEDRYNSRHREDSRQNDRQRSNRDDRYEDKYRTGHDDSYNDKYRTGRDDSYNDKYRTGRDDRYDDKYRTGHDDSYDDKYRTGSDDRYDDGKYRTRHDDSYDDSHNRGHRHSDPNHDHEKCDDVVDEFKRYSASNLHQSTSDTGQAHTSTFV